MIDTHVKELRAELKPFLPFKFWVRKDGNNVWIGPIRHSRADFLYICDVLIEKGYSFEANGTPGTSGEYIIEVYL